MPPQIDVFVTSIKSTPAIRSRHERIERALLSLRVPFSNHDVASDEAAKSHWKRVNGGSNELPCVLVDGERVGTCEQIDEALEFDELRQLFRLDAPSAAPPVVASSVAPTSPAPAATAATASTTADNSFSASSISTADLDLDAELAALSLDHADLQSLLASTGPEMLPSRDRNTSEFSSHYAPTQTTAPLNFTKMKWERPIAVPRGNELEGVDDLTEEEARELARELGMDEEDVEVALAENSVTSSTVSQTDPTASSSAPIPLGPTPGEVPILANVLEVPGAVGPLVDQAEFNSPPKDNDPIAAQTHGELAPPVPAPVPLGPDPSELPALAKMLNSPPGVLDENEFGSPPTDGSGPGPAKGQIGSPSIEAVTPLPLGPDPSLSPRNSISANELDVHGAGPIIDEGEFSEPPKSAEGGPGPIQGQLSPPPPSPKQSSPTSQISPIPIRPVSELHLERPQELSHLPSLEEVQTPAGGTTPVGASDDEVEVLEKAEEVEA